MRQKYERVSRPGMGSGVKTGMSTAPGMVLRVSCRPASSIITTLTELHRLFDIGTLLFTGTIFDLYTSNVTDRSSNPTTGLDRRRGFQEDETARYGDNRHMKVVTLSALGTGRLYTPGNNPGTHFC
jgi:hypothetical protein